MTGHTGATAGLHGLQQAGIGQGVLPPQDGHRLGAGVAVPVWSREHPGRRGRGRGVTIHTHTHARFCTRSAHTVCEDSTSYQLKHRYILMNRAVPNHKPRKVSSFPLQPITVPVDFTD